MISIQQYPIFDQISWIVDSMGDQRAVETLAELHKKIFKPNYDLISLVVEANAEYNDEEIIGDSLVWYLEGMTASDFFEEALKVDSRIELLVPDMVQMIEEDTAC